MATVASSFRSWERLATVVDEDRMHRARVFARIFPLAVVAFAVLDARSPKEVGRSVARAEQGLRTG